MFRERAEHDDGNAQVELAQLPHRLQSIHLGHFDIEQDDVRFERRKLRQRDTAVARRSRHFQRWVPRPTSLRVLRTTTASSTIRTRFLIGTSIRAGSDYPLLSSVRFAMARSLQLDHR